MEYEIVKHENANALGDLYGKHYIACDGLIVVENAENCVFEKCNVKVSPNSIYNCKFVDCYVEIDKSLRFESYKQDESYFCGSIVRKPSKVVKSVLMNKSCFKSCNIAHADFSNYRNMDNVDIDLLLFDDCSIDYLDLSSSRIGSSFYSCRIKNISMQNADFSDAKFSSNLISRFSSDTKTLISGSGDFKVVQAGERDSFSFVYACGNAYVPSSRYFGSLKDIAKGNDKVPSQVSELCKVLIDF